MAPPSPGWALAAFEAGRGLPLALGALGALLLGLAVLEARGEGSRRRRTVRFAIRGSILALLALAAAELVWRTEADAPRRLVVAVDRASLALREGRAAVAELVTAAQAAAEAQGASLAAVAFDADGARAADPGSLPGPTEVPSRLAPALAAARWAAGDGAAAVVLLTDGRAATEGAQGPCDDLRQAGVPLRAVLVPPPPPPDEPTVAVEALSVPTSARGPVAVRATVRARSAGIVRLLVDGAEQARRDLAPGTADFAFDGLLLPEGLHEVAVVAEAEGQGDLRRTLLRVEPPPRALIVASGGDGGFLRRALAAQGFTVEVVDPERAGEAVAATRAGLVALDADAAARLPASAAADLATRVREGLGLWLQAGADASAWVEAGQGPLGPLLPLQPLAPPPSAPPPRGEPPPAEPAASPSSPEPPEPEPGPGLAAERRPEEALPISLLLVIDRSGSMSVEGKLAMALAAARRAAENLAGADRVGVVTFSSEPTLDVPFAPAAAVLALGFIDAPAAEGGTDIHAALVLAQRAIRAETSPIRHVVLLTDGQQYGVLLGPLVEEMAREGITVSTVGLGYTVDERVLRNVARYGRGRYFLAPTPDRLPAVLTRDTRAVLEDRAARAERARIEDPLRRPPAPPAVPEKPPGPPEAPPAGRPPEPPRPPPPTPAVDLLPLRRVRPHDALAGLRTQDLPRVAPPRPTAVREGAALLLERGDGSAVLAAWRAGLGRVLAFALPDDDRAWRAWPSAPRLLAQAARSLAQDAWPQDAAQARVVRGPRGDEVRVSVPEGTEPGAAAANLVVTVDHGLGSEEVRGAEADGGEVVYLLPPPPTGGARASVVRLARRDDPERREVATIAYVPARVGPPAPDPAALAAACGGPTLDAAAPGLWSVPPRRVPVRQSVAALLLLLAALLLPFDAASHRRGPPSTQRR